MQLATSYETGTGPLANKSFGPYTVVPSVVGQLPEVPYAAMLPASLLLAAAAWLWTRRQRIARM